MWADSIHPDTGQKIEVMDDVAPLPVPNDEDILKAYTAAVIAKYLLAGETGITWRSHTQATC
jgi:hypothetical protein